MLVDVLGTNRSRSNWLAFHVDQLKAECELSYYAVKTAEEGFVFRNRRCAAEGIYSHTRCIVAPLKPRITRTISQVTPADLRDGTSSCVEAPKNGDHDPVNGDDQKAPKVEKEHGVIDWKLPAIEVDLLVRAMTPKPGAQTRLGNKRFIVIEGTVEQDLYGMGIPGGLQSSGEEGIRVCTGKDLYRITRIKPDNGRNMTAGEFVRGHHIAPDARFG